MPLNYPTMPGDIDHLIAADHAVVERQFQHLAAGRGDRRALVDQVVFELALHADAEERVLYPALADAGEEESSHHSRDEHEIAKELLVTLSNTKPGEPDFETALSSLIAAVREHVLVEESKVLPRFRELVGAQEMARLGGEFLGAKRGAPTYAHPSAPSSERGHKMMDPAARVMDLMRDKFSGRIKHLATDPSGALDPQAQRLLDAFAALEPKPPEILTPQQARLQPTIADAVRKMLTEDGRPAGPEPVGRVENIPIPGAGGELSMRVYAPADATGLLPIVVWVHGGGWVLHTVDTYDASCRGLANETRAIVVAPEYRQAPEHVFPAAHDDVLAAFRWVRANAERIGGDPERIAIGGESAGATMAAATSLALSRAGEKPPVAQVLVYPLTTAELFGESMADAADARPLNRPLLSWLSMHAFHGAPDARSDPRIDLLGIAVAELALLPPTLVITAERDVLRSQGEEFARRLDSAGVQVAALRFDGVMHEFFGAAGVLDAADRAQQAAAEHLLTGFARVPSPA